MNEEDYIEIVRDATFDAMKETGYVPKKLGGDPNAFTGNKFRTLTLSKIIEALKERLNNTKSDIVINLETVNSDKETK